MGDLLVVQSKVKEAVKKTGGKDFRCSGDAVGALSKKVEALVRDATTRAKENKRKTVKAQDF